MVSPLWSHRGSPRVRNITIEGSRFEWDVHALLLLKVLHLLSIRLACGLLGDSRN